MFLIYIYIFIRFYHACKPLRMFVYTNKSWSGSWSNGVLWHTYIFIYVYIYMYISLSLDMHIYIYVYIYICLYLCMPAIRTYTCCKCHETLQSEFLTRVVVVRERLSSREQETTGKWMTEERLKASGEYTQWLDMGRAHIWSIGYIHLDANVYIYTVLFWSLWLLIYVLFT
jgi:hypothetical protein